jgi:hypothetical protein
MSAINPLDPFEVIDENGVPIETHALENRAHTAAQWLNEHEALCKARGQIVRAFHTYTVRVRADLCPRTLALYKPGQPMPGVPHHFAYTGSVPCTGSLRCTLCGVVKS